MNQTDKLAYFLDADQLAGVFAEWPDDMNVVLCLEDSGDCEIVVYHQDEGHSVLSKVAGILERPVGEFTVVPEMRGYPTRKVFFSEEQKLLTLVADTIDLPETALDYAINYRYAKDQGLNPDTMRPRETTAKPAPLRAERRTFEARSEGRPAFDADHTAEVITPTFRHRELKLPPRVSPEIRARAARPKGIKPRLRLTMGGLAQAVKAEPTPVAAPVIEPQYPPGYAPAAQLMSEECHVFQAELVPQADVIRLVIARDKVTVKTAPVRVEELLFRDDLSRFMLARDTLAAWAPGAPAVLDIPVAQFPPAIVDRFTANPRAAEVTVTGKGVFVTPGDAMPEKPKAANQSRPLLRGVVTPMRAAMLALVAVGAAAGAILNYAQDPVVSGADRRASNIATPTDQIDPEVTRFIGTPLDLIGTMAREAGQ